MRSGAVDIVVIDSVAALVPKAEIDGDMGDSHVGLQARLMSQALRKLAGLISKTNCICLFINQLREKVGVMFGNPETTTGGKALKFYATIRLDIRRAEPLKAGNEIVGNRTKIKVVKNKVAPPFKTCECRHALRRGHLARGLGPGPCGGARHRPEVRRVVHYGDVRIGQGRENARKYLKEHPEMFEEIEQKLRTEFTANPNEIPMDMAAGDPDEAGDEDESLDDEFEI